MEIASQLHPLFTSIQPNISRTIKGEECGAAYQALCIQSWRDAGFKVYSLNNAREITMLAPLHREVEFIEVESNIPKITDFFDAGRKINAEMIAITNADIIMTFGSDILQGIITSHINHFIIARRIDIDSDTLDITLQPGGIDFFMFNFSIISQNIYKIFDEMNLRIGSPWWDMALPGLAILESNALLNITPVLQLFHLSHTLQWTDSTNKENSEKFLNIIARYYNHSEIVLNYESEYNNKKKFDSYFSECINKNSKIILYPKLNFENPISALKYVVKRKNFIYEHALISNTFKSLKRKNNYLKAKLEFYFVLKIIIYNVFFFFTRNRNFKIKIDNVKKHLKYRLLI